MRQGNWQGLELEKVLALVWVGKPQSSRIGSSDLLSRLTSSGPEYIRVSTRSIGLSLLGGRSIFPDGNVEGGIGEKHDAYHIFDT